MKELVIGLDIGTGSSKGVLAQTDGTVIATSVQKHQTSFPSPGFAEHDAEGVWWKDCLEILRDLTAQAEGKVAAVCISGIGPCFLPTDEAGTPLRPGILYGVDTRAHKEITEMTKHYGHAWILENCGNDITSQSVGPKIEWVRRNEPEVWQKTKMWFMAHTYCIFKLTGAYVVDRMSVSMAEPLYSPFTADWIHDVFEEVAPGLIPPELRWSDEIAGYVTEEAAQITGLEPGIPVAVGTLDAFSESLSIGVVKPGDVMLMYGSTMVMNSVSESPMIEPSLWSLSGMLEGTCNLAGGMSTTGSLTNWVCDLVGSDHATLMAEATESLPGSNGLLCLPYFSGERTPIADPNARGVLVGLNLTHARKDLYRSTLEATAFGTRHLLEVMRNAGASCSRLVAVGGGTTGGLWPQIISDVLGEPQEIPKITIGAAYGDCILAAMTIGAADASTNWNELDRLVEPNPANKELYDVMYQAYLDIYQQTADIQHTLAGLQK